MEFGPAFSRIQTESAQILFSKELKPNSYCDQTEFNFFEQAGSIETNSRPEKKKSKSLKKKRPSIFKKKKERIDEWIGLETKAESEREICWN